MGNIFIILKRSTWEAQDPKETKPLTVPTPAVVFHHTGGETCTSKKKCIEALKKLQQKHMNEENLSDIKYNFLIGGDAQVYEGRGWTVQGEHVEGYNDQTIGIAFIGDFDDILPQEEVLEACRGLMYHGVRKGYLQEGVEAFPHAHFDENTLCPGMCIIDEYFTEGTLDPNEFWGKRTFIGKLWDRIRGMD